MLEGVGPKKLYELATKEIGISLSLKVNSIGGNQNLNKWMDFKAKATSKVVLTIKSLTLDLSN